LSRNSFCKKEENCEGVGSGKEELAWDGCFIYEIVA